MQVNHKSIYDIHKDSSNENIGFRIEFLQLNVANDGLDKQDTLILGDTSESHEIDYGKELMKTDDDSMQYIIIANESDKKVARAESKNKLPKTPKQKKRSWVWNYFDKLSSIIFKCNVCSVVLSIKGSNTNNMNRHMKSRHPAIYNKEMLRYPGKRKDSQECSLTDVACEVEIDLGNATKLDENVIIREASKNRVSWVWNYFTRTSRTHAQCKLCTRNIAHGGNATGNMNRHLKALHEDVYNTNAVVTPKKEPETTMESETDWIWKLFSDDEDHFYECKMCGFKCMKFTNHNKSVAVILKHLKTQHEVVSGEQIVTAAECPPDLDESTIAVDFLKDTEEI